MEDLLGWLMLVALFTIPVAVTYTGIRLYRRSKQRQYEAEQRWIDSAREEARVKREQAREEMARAQARAKRLNLKTPTKESLAKMKNMPNASYTKTTHSSSTSTTTVPVNNDSLLSDLATLYVLNSALQHGSASASVDYDAGTIKVDSDDSSSRKSSYDSGPSYSDTGPSYSSSSDSYSSSSSDSGPSSDW